MKKTRSQLENKLTKYGIYPPFIEWLQEMKFPYLRSRPKNNRLYPRIEVGADSMRVGKTTAVKVIASHLKNQGLKVHQSFEDLGNNPYLKKSYSDPTKALLKSQKWFAARKYEQVKQGAPNHAFIQDVHPEMDYCYAVTNALMGRMSLRQFDEYLTHFNKLDWPAVPFPDLLIYLTVSDDVLVERAQTTARKFEVIDQEYFLVMKIVNRTWLEKVKEKTKVILIDTDDFDFSKSESAKDRLGSMVIKALKLNPKNLNGQKKSYELTTNQLAQLNSSKIVIMCGLPGSGKSYIAKKIQKSIGADYLSTDQIRTTTLFKNQQKYLKDSSQYEQQKKLVYDSLFKSIVSKAKSGKPVIADATFLDSQRLELLNILGKENLLKKAIFVSVKSDKNLIKKRILNKQRRLKNKQFEKLWQKAYDYHDEKLQTHKSSYPDQKKDGVKVIEVWNQ
jgi:deoxyadenosine/deoxycytidine kinase/predicted kinase